MRCYCINETDYIKIISYSFLGLLSIGIDTIFIIYYNMYHSYEILIFIVLLSMITLICYVSAFIRFCKWEYGTNYVFSAQTDHFIYPQEALNTDEYATTTPTITTVPLAPC